MDEIANKTKKVVGGGRTVAGISIVTLAGYIVAVANQLGYELDAETAIELIGAGVIVWGLVVKAYNILKKKGFI